MTDHRDAGAITDHTDAGNVVVAKARDWIGTPYVHQASQKQAGTDCLGLIHGIWREIYGTLPEHVPPYSMDWAEVDGAEVLWAAARRYLKPKDLDHSRAGDVLLFRMCDGAVAKHLGIQSAPAPRTKFIHAYSGHAVCETALSAPWARRIIARFSFPERYDKWQH